MLAENNSNRLLNDKHLKEIRGQLGTEQVLMERGILLEPDTNKKYYTGYDYKTLYDWDQYFEAIIQIYMGWPSEFIKNGVTIFLDHQQADGLISRSVPSNIYHDPEHVKPFLCQTILLVDKYYGELDWVLNDTYYPRLKKYLNYWLVEMDSNGSGLSEWMSAPHTGMDNQHERAGWWEDRISEGVDLNCYLYLELIAFACLADRYGQPEDAATFREHASKKKEAIQRLLWDDDAGFYFDRHIASGKPICVKTIAGLMPLWAGVCSEEQAERLVHEHLHREDMFWSPWPVATMSRKEPGYSRTTLPDDLGCNWRACVWIPTNYMVYHGLKRYGYDQIASLLANRTQELVRHAGNREWYDAETGEGCGLDPFWGWSLLAHFMAYEELHPGEPNPQLEL